MVPLTERFKELPIDTMERLEKTIDLVFEKVIYLSIVFIIKSFNCTYRKITILQLIL